MTKVTVKLPACWRALVETNFEDLPDPEGVLNGENHSHSIDDPVPYRDDVRGVSVALEGGGKVTFFLCSGQSNYWGEFDILRDGRIVYESEVLEQYEDVRDVKTEDGETFEIKVEWEESG